jgi:Transglycosylase SLT domain
MTAHTNNWPNAALLRIKQVLEALTGGFVAATHNSLAVLGMALALAIGAMVAKPDWRVSAEQHLLGWLLERQSDESALTTDPVAVERATAAHPNELPKNQANVALWLSRKYRVAPEPLSALVAEAFAVGQRVRLEPTLILAVMAIESRFNPFAQSSVGAQGLMQVMTRVHTDKYSGFGGAFAAFDPLTNLRVGVQVLQDCVKRTGSVEAGLACYVGNVSNDGADYVAKVLTEHQRLQHVAQGVRVPTSDSIAKPSNTPTPTMGANTDKNLAAGAVPSKIWVASGPANTSWNGY